MNDGYIVTNQSRPLTRIAVAISGILLIETYSVLGVLTLLLVVGFHNGVIHMQELVVGCLFTIGYVCISRFFVRKSAISSIAYLLVTFYMLMATVITLKWGIDMPIGLLIFGIVIVIAGVMLTSRGAIYLATASSLVLFATQALNELGWYKSDTTWLTSEPSFGGVVVYGAVFYFLALVSWLYNREIERAFAHAQAAERALLKQKASLQEQVILQTQELRDAQLEEMRQLYRFAEIGQSGATLLHELANRLTTLTLEVEEIHKNQHSKAIARVSVITKSLDDLVSATCDKIHGLTRSKKFNVVEVVNDAVAYLQFKAERAGVTIDVETSRRVSFCCGDPMSLGQVIAILISNAVDSYDGLHDVHEKRVSVTLGIHKRQARIKVQDRGKGIDKDKRKHLFRPFHTSKKTGLGIGLFIARQTIQTDFSGSLVLSPRTDMTEFIIMIPLNNDDKSNKQ